MSPLKAALLGLVQGVTEFLPISSEAHLILFSRLLGWPDQGLRFDIAAHLGSLLAVMVYFRRDLASLVRSGWRGGRRDPAARGDARLAGQLLLATVPVAVVGLLLQEQVATVGRSSLLIAATSILFGLLLGWSDRAPVRHAGLERMTAGRALVVGLAQALALLPGSSRSGVTITAARWLGFSREQSARFSFLLAVPVGLLVAAKQGLDLATEGPGGTDWAPLGIGFVTAALSAFGAVHWLLAWLRRQGLAVFVVYRVLLGLLLIGLWLGS